MQDLSNLTYDQLLLLVVTMNKATEQMNMDDFIKALAFMKQVKEAKESCSCSEADDFFASLRI